MLKQLLSIASFLLTKENKLLFSFRLPVEQMEICHFRFQFAENKQKLPFSMRVYVCVRVCTCVEVVCVCIYMQQFPMENGKRKPSRFVLILSSYAHRANGSLRLIYLLTKNQTEVCKQTTQTTWTCPSMVLNKFYCTSLKMLQIFHRFLKTLCTLPMQH